jgi:hypothetical protein
LQGLDVICKYLVNAKRSSVLKQREEIERKWAVLEDGPHLNRGAGISPCSAVVGIVGGTSRSMGGI